MTDYPASDDEIAVAIEGAQRLEDSEGFYDVVISGLRELQRRRVLQRDQGGEWLPAPPDRSGMYHVYLSDGGQIITPYTSPDEDPGEDSCGDRRPVGWVGLKDWNGRVLFYRLLPPSPENT